MELEQAKINEEQDNKKFKEPEWMIILTKLIEKKPELMILAELCC